VKGDGNLYAIHIPKESVSHILLTNFIYIYLETVSILNCSSSSSSKGFPY
jgi:hypothetical protein